jgi:hypothetical protein
MTLLGKSTDVQFRADIRILMSISNSFILKCLYEICGSQVNDCEIMVFYIKTRRSQWPHGLRHELSSPAWTLGSWVQNPLEAWMCVCIYSVFVLFCVQISAVQRTDPPSKESYRLCIRLRNCKSGQGPTEDCRTTHTHIYMAKCGS